MSLIVEVNSEDQPHAVAGDRLATAVRQVMAEAGIQAGEISVAVVTDEQIHVLNRQYLDHDYPTDVLSFVLEHDGNRLDGEIIVSSDYARRESERFGWTTADELLLYVIHGSLHLVGYDDQTPEAAQAMRAAEVRHLAQFGLEHRYDAAEG
ncbi:MAG: rRNA maturation RNase YbeY [Pirellulaceae bacterium]|nr:rRNA maturation RNase YbeY [Pirellulaceae bacterium]